MEADYENTYDSLRQDLAAPDIRLGDRGSLIWEFWVFISTDIIRRI